MFTENTYALGMLNDNVTSTSSAVGVAIDLANYFSVGKREIKFIVSTCWTSATAATAETVTISIQESDSTSSAGSTVTGTEIETHTSGAGAEATTEYNVLVSKRYIHARAVGSAACGFGVAVVALPARRFAQ